jgi:hypothetical protein
MNTPTTPTTPDELLDYWLGNIPFKGRLVSDDGTCMDAQGPGACIFLMALALLNCAITSRQQ